MNDLYTKATSYAALYAAYQRAAKNRGKNLARIAFARHLEENLITLRDELAAGTYRPGKYTRMTVYEPKKRIIEALPFRDRVVQQALFAVLLPLFERSMIYDSYACRKGKGTIRGAKRAQKFLRAAGASAWVLKGDIYHFFASMEREKILLRIARKVHDARMLASISLFLPQERGVPIGNLMSQLFANVLLDAFDHYMMDARGNGRYVRYMDDFILVLPSKARAKRELAAARAFLLSLGLTLNGKTQIFPARQGINFLGFYITRQRMRLRRETVRRVKWRVRRFRKLRARHLAHVMDCRPWLSSYLGFAKHGDCAALTRSVLRLLNGGVLIEEF